MNVISELKVCIIPLMSSESADVISDDHEYVSCNHSAVSGTSVWSSNLERDLVSRGSSRVRILGGGDLGVDLQISEIRTGFRVSAGVGSGHVWVEVESRSRRGRVRVARGSVLGFRQ